MNQLTNNPSTTTIPFHTIRHLKIRKRICERLSSQNAHFPELILCGKWMQDLGFTDFQTAKIECSPGMIIITPCLPSEPLPDSKPSRKRK